MKILLLIAICSIGCFAQSELSSISTKCPGTNAVAEIKIVNGNIVLQPCPDGQILAAGPTQSATINGSNFSSLADFSSAPDYTTNTVSQSSGGTQTFRLGSNKTYFETVQRSTGARNEIRLRTDETNPCCGGFADIFLQSDKLHSYGYFRAQRFLYLRSDGLEVSNFFDNGKWRIRMEMPSIAALPDESTGRFRVGNYRDRTNFIDLKNYPNDMTLTLGAVNGIFLRNKVHLVSSQTPGSSVETCSAGQIAWDADYIYVCTQANTWKRTILSVF